MTVANAFVRSGKVRDIYSLDADRVLLVASDRLSAFDVVLPTPIPDKGRVLTGLSRFWFEATAELMPNHLLSVDPAALPAGLGLDAADLRGRAMVCRRVDILPIECVVRGYLAGSGWKDYRAGRVVSGVRLARGLRDGDRLPAPIFTPSTKADAGHDEPISFDQVVAILAARGFDDAHGGLAERVRDLALRLYSFGAATCERAGIILADTKFEMGLESSAGELVLADEVMTPDSSRFWDAATWEPGHAQPSYDKQYVRDWLEAQSWDKTPPGPELPAEIVAGTRARYVQAYERITGADFGRYLQEDVIAR